MFNLFWGRGENLKTRQAVTYLFNSYTILGINPTKRLRWIYYIYFVATYLFLCIFLQLTFNFTYFMDKSEIPIGQLLTSLQAAINVWGIPPKSIAMVLGLSSLRRAETLMDTLDARCTLPEEIMKIRHTVVIGNRIVITFVAIYYVYGLSTTIGSCVNGQTPYSLYLPFWEWRNSRHEYWQQIALELFIMLLLLFHQVVYDCYPAIYIYILRTHVQILVDRVYNLGQNEDGYTDLINCVKDHQCILELMSYVSPVVSVTVFVQFFISAAILGVTMINVLIFADPTTKVGSIFYYFAVLIQTFPTCYYATLLIADCERLPMAIFHCNWIDQSRQFRKMLQFFIQHTQKPITFSALKFVPITLNSFLSIAKFSFSLYTLIKEMDFGQNLKPN